MNKLTLLFGITLGITLAISGATLAKNFPDVNTQDWFYDYVQKIEQWGIISGNDDGTFAPERNVVRAELSKMFVLLDERTDEKITASNATLQLSVNESLNALETMPEPVPVVTEVSSALPSSLILRKRNNPTNLCPDDWDEIDSGYAGSDNSRVNTRTCVTRKRCEVLTLTKHTNNPPVACPTDWTEASFGQVEEQDVERVCFICEAST